MYDDAYRFTNVHIRLLFTNYKKNDNYQFSKFNLNLLMIALASIIIAFVGIYLSINYWLTNEPLLVNFKILGRYFVPSITLILFSFQIIMDVILFNFLKKVSK